MAKSGEQADEGLRGRLQRAVVDDRDQPRIGDLVGGTSAQPQGRGAAVLASARREPLGQPLRRRRDQHRMSVLVEAVGGEEMLARARDHDGQPRSAPDVDFAADAIAIAVRLPVEGEQPALAAQRELRRGQRDMVLAA